jgi:sulfoxide reductase catalytic subunit YedY
MIIKTKSDIMPSEITPKEVFDNRRQFIKKAGMGLIASAAILSNNPIKAAILETGTIGELNRSASALKGRVASRHKISSYNKTVYGVGEKLTSYEDITTYNNYYEFGTDKNEPAINSKLFNPHPWIVSI